MPETGFRIENPMKPTSIQLLERTASRNLDKSAPRRRGTLPSESLSPWERVPRRGGGGSQLRLPSKCALHNIREGPNKHGVAVQCRDTPEVLNPGVLGHFLVKDIQFIQGFNVLGHETNGNGEHVINTLFSKLHDRIVRERLEPFDRPDFALKRKPVRICPAELIHDRFDRLLCLLEVGIAVSDVAFRNTMGAE